MDNTTLFEKTSEYAKMVGADFYPSFILNDGIVVSGEFEKQADGEPRRAMFSIFVNGRNEEEMAETIVESVKEILIEIEKAAESANFSYSTVHFAFKNSECSIVFAKNIKGVYTECAVHTGCMMHGDKPMVSTAKLAALAVNRQSEWFERMEEEARTVPETKVKPFTMQPVKSAAISQIGHNGDTLRVKFNSGQTYDYQATTEQFSALVSAESIGKHFREHFGSAKGKLVE